MKFTPAPAPHQNQLYPEGLARSTRGQGGVDFDVWLHTESDWVRLAVEVSTARITSRLSPSAARELAAKLIGAADHIEAGAK